MVRARVAVKYSVTGGVTMLYLVAVRRAFRQAPQAVPLDPRRIGIVAASLAVAMWTVALL